MIWAKLIWRDVRFNGVLWFLSILGVAVGVGGWVGMEMATDRAGESFRQSLDTTFGSATHVIEHPTDRLDEAVYFRLSRNYQGDFTPVIEEYGRLPENGESTGPTLRLQGIDPLSYASVHGSLGAGQLPLAEFLAGDSVAVLSPDLQSRFRDGDTVSLRVSDQTIDLRVSGFLDDNTINQTVFVDIGMLQQTTGPSGTISRVLARMEDSTAKNLRDDLSNNQLVLPTGSRTRSVRSMVSAFEWNLRALSFLSLFVGAFLVYSTMFLYTSRQVNLISLLKAIGVSQRSIWWLLSGGLLLIGLAGSSFGVLLGLLMGVPMSEMVTATVDQLYMSLYAGVGGVRWPLVVGGFCLGGAMTLIGGIVPIWNRLGTPAKDWNRHSIETGSNLRGVFVLGAVGLGAWAFAYGLIQVSDHLLAGFASCFLIAIGGSLISPAILRGLTHLPTAGTWSFVAARNVRYYGRRTGVMVAVLVAAFSMVFAVSVMVDSFRTSVDRWVESVVRADFYVRSTPGNSRDGAPPLTQAFLRDLRSVEGVREIGTLRERTVLLGGGEPLTVRGIEPSVLRNRIDYQFNDRRGDPWRRLKQGGGWLSEPGSYRLGVGVGDTVVIPSAGSVSIDAVYNDYSTEWAVLYLASARMERLMGTVKPRSTAVFTGDGLDRSRLESLVRKHGYFLESSRDLRRRAMREFDRTFAVTDLMKIVASVVAGVGLLVLIISFVRDRASEFNRLRAVGSTRTQLIGLLLLETATVAVGALVVAVPTGLYLSHVLVNVINRRSFGWLIPHTVTPTPFLSLVGLMGLAVFLSLLVPVYRLWTGSIGETLREANQ